MPRIKKTARRLQLYLSSQHFEAVARYCAENGLGYTEFFEGVIELALKNDEGLKSYIEALNKVEGKSSGPHN